MVDDNGDKRSGPDPDTLDVVAAVLAAGGTASDAGAVVNRSARTVRRWLVETDLDDRVATYRREVLHETTENMLHETAGNLAGLAAVALQVVRDAMVEGELALQLRAALAVLDRAPKYHAVSEVDRTVRELTARIAELEQKGSAS